MDKYTLLLLSVTIVGWGAWGFLAKLGMQTIGKYPHIMFTYLVGFLGLAFIVCLLVFTKRLEITLSTGYIYPLLAGLSMITGTIAYFMALERAPLSIVSPLAALYPVLIVILAVAFLHEQLKIVHIIGVGFALVAVYLLSS